MRYCKKCVQPDTRPGIHFNENGICAACLWQEKYNNDIDWDERYDQIKTIADQAKEKSNSNGIPYDCVIGVSGGKDSTFQALYARDRLGLRCLLVNGAPDNINEIGQKNIDNLSNLGFDLISLRPDPNVMRSLVKKDFYRYANPVKATEYPLWASAYIIADRFNIPLIIQGENQGLTMGTLKGFGKDDDALNTNKQHTIEKNCMDEYIDIAAGTGKKELFFYDYDEVRLREKGIRAVWIQYYAKEWSSPGNGELAILNGLTLRPKDYAPYEIGQYWRFNALDGGSLVYVNQMIKQVKLGFGASTDSACYEIREGRITREEGIRLIREFDGKCADRYIEEFCEYIDISVDEFWRVVDSFRGNMWEKISGVWRLIDPIWEQINVNDVNIDHVLNYHRNIDSILLENKSDLQLKQYTHPFS